MPADASHNPTSSGLTDAVTPISLPLSRRRHPDSYALSQANARVSALLDRLVHARHPETPLHVTLTPDIPAAVMAPSLPSLDSFSSHMHYEDDKLRVLIHESRRCLSVPQRHTRSSNPRRSIHALYTVHVGTESVTRPPCPLHHGGDASGACSCAVTEVVTSSAQEAPCQAQQTGEDNVCSRDASPANVVPVLGVLENVSDATESPAYARLPHMGDHARRDIATRYSVLSAEEQEAVVHLQDNVEVVVPLLYPININSLGVSRWRRVAGEGAPVSTGCEPTG